MKASHLKIASIALVFLGSNLLVACDPAFPDLVEAPAWQAKLKPALVCQGEHVNFEYRFPVVEEVGVYSPQLMTAGCDAARFDCNNYYPVVGFESAGLFPAGRHHLRNYEGSLQSAPLGSVGTTTIAASVLASSATTTNAGGAVDRLISPSPWRLTDVRQTAMLSVDSIAIGGSSAAPVLFNGQCAGGVASWTPVALEVGEARSSGAKLRQICNRESLRSVMFVAKFSSGLTANLSETSVLPGSCIRVAEAEPNFIRTIAAVPSPDPMSVGRQCGISSDFAPPAPVRAEFTYGCDGG
jgi:hypothetical protein